MPLTMSGKYKVRTLNLSANGKYYVELGDPETFELFTFVFEGLPTGMTEGVVVDIKPTPIEMKPGKFGPTFRMKTKPGGGE